MEQAFVAIHNECTAEGFPVDEDVMVKAIATFVLPDGDDVMQHLYCSSKKMGFQEEDGSMNEDLIRQYATALFGGDSVKVDNFIGTCLVAKSTPAETAHDAIQCFLNIFKS